MWRLVAIAYPGESPEVEQHDTHSMDGHRSASVGTPQIQSLSGADPPQTKLPRPGGPHVQPKASINSFAFNVWKDTFAPNQFRMEPTQSKPLKLGLGRSADHLLSLKSFTNKDSGDSIQGA